MNNQEGALVQPVDFNELEQEYRQAKNEYRDVARGLRRSIARVAEQEARERSPHSADMQDYHTTLTMNGQESSSVLPVDINQLELGHRQDKNEHQNKAFRTIKVYVAAKATKITKATKNTEATISSTRATKATVTSKIASSSNKATKASVSSEVNLAKASKTTEDTSVEVFKDTEHKATE